MSQVSYRAREYLWVVTQLDLEIFCNQFRIILRLPAFDFDWENVWQWGLTKIENGYVEINISRKHKHGEPLIEEPIMVLLLVDSTAPVNYDKEWLMENLILVYGQTIANLTMQSAYYGVVEYVSGEDFVYKPSRTFKPQN